MAKEPQEFEEDEEEFEGEEEEERKPLRPGMGHEFVRGEIMGGGSIQTPSNMKELDRHELFTWLSKAVERAMKHQGLMGTPKGGTNQALPPVTKEGVMYTFELRHATGDRSSATVEQFFFRPTEDSLDDLCKEIADKAEEDAGGNPGDISFYHLISDITKGRKSFTVSAEDREGIGARSEGPNGQGLVAQAMRHQERCMEMAVSSSVNMQKMMVRLLDSKERRLEAMETERFKRLMEFEDMTQRKHERDLDIRKQVRDEEMKEMVMNQLMSLAPVVVNKALGARVMPEPTTPTKELTKAIFSSLTEEQFEAFASKLEPHQMIAFKELYETLKAEENASTAAQKAKMSMSSTSSASNTSPEQRTGT